MTVRTQLPSPVIAIGRFGFALVGFLVAAVLAFLAFVWYPTDLVEVIGVLAVLLLGALGFRLGRNLGSVVFPDYNVAEVTVEGPITRDGGRPTPTPPGHPSADALVELIEQAGADPAVEGLLLRLNTPGGEVVPSDDLCRAVAAFEGPTIAYTDDLCASGGYWIASGCDTFLAHEASLVGSIGVRGSLLNVAELADRLGVRHERFTAGAYKDAGSPFRDMEAHEREYLQGLIDGQYETFLDRVVEGRALDEDTVRETEARVYRGEEAVDLGLVDELGGRDEAEGLMADRLDLPETRVRTFEPERPITVRLRGGIERIAFAVGAGVASHLLADEVPLPE